MESITHMVAHSQTNPPLLLHPPLPTLNFQLSIRFPAPHSYLPSPGFYSSTFPLLHPFLFPFQSFIPNPPLFLSYIFRSTPIFFCSLSHSPFQFSLHSNHLSLWKFTFFFFLPLPFPILLVSSPRKPSTPLVPLLLRFHSASPLFSFQQQSACDLFHFFILYLPLHLLFSTLNFHHSTFLFAILHPSS